MVKEFLEILLNTLKSRIFVLVLLFSGLFGILIYRVFYLQIVREDYYLSNYIQTAEREVLTAGTRGLIYDRNGDRKSVV